MSATNTAATIGTPLRSLQHAPSLDTLLADRDAIAAMADDIRHGAAYIVPGVLDPDICRRLCNWLADVGRNSLPAWHPIAAGAPNHHRMNKWDERAYVRGCFHQFSFFPWNQDPFDLFDRMRGVYALKNRLSGHAPTSFLDRTPTDGLTARLSVHTYPAGGGDLSPHADPVGPHQLTVPSILLSTPGTDYHTGGLYVLDPHGDPVDVDPHMAPGDALYFNAQTPHGVAPVDPDADLDWLSFAGRWSLIAAVNRTADNDTIDDSVDLRSR